MNRVKLRSPRDPEFWLPLGLGVAAVLALGYGGHAWVSELVEGLEARARSDPQAALDEAVFWLRRATRVFCVLLVLFCLFLFRSCQLARREGRLPPSGWWSYGALSAITGAPARRAARFGQWLAGLLLLASFGLAIAVEHFTDLLLAGTLTP